jgi:hypothetical protein
VGKLKDQLMSVDCPPNSSEYVRGREEASRDILRSAGVVSEGMFIEINVAASIARGESPVTLRRSEKM